MRHVNIIGSGRVGQTLGRLLVDSKRFKIGGVLNQDILSSQKAIEFIGEGSCIVDWCALPVADVTLITTPDDKIASVVLQLATHAKWRSGDVVLHCSGLYTSDSLSALRAKGCWVASVHPLRSFAVPCLSVQAYPGTFCAIEGDESALPLLHEWFAAIGSVPFNIPKAGKALYHAGSVFASNYLITLAVEAKTCFEAAGIEPGLVADLISQLMQSAVTNLRVSGMFCESLTGPLARGDLATVKNHLTALPSEQRELYKILAKATLPMTTLTALQRNDLTAVLNQ